MEKKEKYQLRREKCFRYYPLNGYYCLIAGIKKELDASSENCFWKLSFKLSFRFIV